MSWLSALLGTVRSTTQAAGARGKVQARILGAEDEHERVQPYGFTSRPIAGAECIALPTGGNHDELVVIVIGDRRYSIALAAGEVAISDDRGQKIHLTQSGGIVIVGKDVTVTCGTATLSASTVLLGDGSGGRRRVVREGDIVTGATLVSVSGGPVTGAIAIAGSTTQVTAS